MANPDYLKTPGGVLKVAEIVLALVALLIMRIDELHQFNIDAAYFGIGSLVCSLIITPLFLIVYLMGHLQIQQTVMEVCVNFLMAFMLVVFGSMAMDRFTEDKVFMDGVDDKKDTGIAMATFALAAGITYLVDTLIAAMKFRSEFA